jgi:hypothetical protein
VAAADLERLVLLVGDKLVPVVINDGREEDCYLLSPLAHYVKYMLIELGKMGRNRAARATAAAVRVLGQLCRPLGFNQCVSVNNWLFTTNPTLSLSTDELAGVTRLLARRYPRYAIVIRSVDARDPQRRRLYESAGYRLVVNRPVHEWNPNGMRRSQRRHIRQDLRQLGDPRFEICRQAPLSPGGEEAIAALYTQLYVKKHAGYNARYTARFFRSVLDARMMNLTTVRMGQVLAAFTTELEDGDRTIAALVGYDTALDQRRYPLYRMAVASAFEHAWTRRRRLFLSTGAAAFKTYRGSFEWLEYEAIYDRHLPVPRRLPWALFGRVLDATVGSLDTIRL